jgi:hypothetical protein
MGYTFVIGELFWEEYQEEDDWGNIISVEKIEAATEHTSSDAPVFGAPSDGVSMIYPSYGVWEDFVDYVGLRELFYGTEKYGATRTHTEYTPLLREHPDCVPLCDRHLQEVDRALTDFYKKYPEIVPGYTGLDDDTSIYSASLARLLWLHFWIKWALNNCKSPMFQNW